MAPLERQLPFYGDWECCTCCEEFSEEELSTPWQTEEQDLVCENCIKAEFDMALQFEAYWPARWGGQILDVEDYDVFLPETLISEYISRSAEIIAEREIFEPEIPPNQSRGRDYQLCPDCRKVIYLRDGCNHLVCLCGANFCFVCGNTAFDDGSGHWNEHGGCPRYLHGAVGPGNGLHAGETTAPAVHEVEIPRNGVRNGVNGMNGVNEVSGSNGVNGVHGQEESEEGDSEEGWRL